MYGRMVNFRRKFADKGYVKKIGAVFVAASTVAACKYTYTVPTFNNLAWFDNLKSQYKDRSQKQPRNLHQNVLPEHDEKSKKEPRTIHPIDNEIRIVVIGATDFAKSTTGSILRQEEKTPWCHVGKTQMKTLHQKIDLKEYKIDVIDTPTNINNHKKTNKSKNLQAVIKRVISLSAPGLHAFILCIPATKVQSEFTDIITNYETHFRKDCYDYVIVAFTHYEDFEFDQDKGIISGELKRKRFIEKIRSVSEKENVFGKLKNVAKNHIVLNTYMEPDEKAEQIKEVIDIINERESKGKKFATCVSSQAAESELQKRMKDIIKKETKRGTTISSASEINKLRDEVKNGSKYLDSFQIRNFKTEKRDKKVTPNANVKATNHRK